MIADIATLVIAASLHERHIPEHRINGGTEAFAAVDHAEDALLNAQATSKQRARKKASIGRVISSHRWLTDLRGSVRRIAVSQRSRTS